MFFKLSRSQIFTHRGLEPSRPDFWPESSYEAFQDHLARGYGIEFDPNFCYDGIVVSHDASLKRITEGRDERNFSDVSVEELASLRYGPNPEKQGRIPTLDEVLGMISSNSSALSAMHFKAKYQGISNMRVLISYIEKHKLLDRLVIFDVKPEIAHFMKLTNNRLMLAPSVAHPYDIKRYGSVVGNSLVSTQDAISFKDVYDWAWLDEWDTADEEGKEKRLYTAETFDTLRAEGYKIALVTPELHGTSPGLYGGESHKDAASRGTLFRRIREIIELRPDAICTDYPEEAAAGL